MCADEFVSVVSHFYADTKIKTFSFSLRVAFSLKVKPRVTPRLFTTSSVKMMNILFYDVCSDNRSLNHFRKTSEQLISERN